MKKYLSIFRLSWQNSLVYRLNFVMWRLRVILRFLGIYFFWLAIFARETTIFNYQRSTILTYIIMAAFLRSLVLSSRSVMVNVEIASGDLNNYLVKPLSYLKNWFARDLADKAMNLIFFCFEISLFYLLVKPPLVGPASWWQLLAFVFSAFLALLLYFFFSFIVSCFAFWYPEHNGWPLRFIVFSSLGFLSGEAFPLDILSPLAQKIFNFLPFPYFIFYPLQIYFGRLSPLLIIKVFFLQFIWLLALYFLAKFLYQKGLKIYGAYGR